MLRTRPQSEITPVGVWLRNYGLLLLALAVECAIFEILARHNGRPSFLSLNSLMLVLNHCAVFGVAAVGMTFVIITGGIDLSVGSLIAFGGVICAKTLLAGGEPVALWIGIGWMAALAAGVAAGAFAALFVTRFDIPPFIATLALMSSLRGLGYIIAKGQPISPLPEAYQFAGRHQIGGVVPVSVIIMLCTMLAGAIILNKTRLGRAVRAIGGNEESARLSGINVRRVKAIVYMMSGALAVAAGLILSSKLGAGSPKVGMGNELDVIAAVVVGGTSLSGGRGTIGGTLVGLLIISVLNSGLNWIGVESFGQQVTLGLVILAAVLLDRLKRA